MNIIIPYEKLKSALEAAFASGGIAATEAGRRIMSGGKALSDKEIDDLAEASAIDIIRLLKQ